ncbi:helix-turn-helix transcriptional regulator [Corynebacterium antarcticum]|uniref:helix-turn-helix transcriptional regulator n=1 Tax=Corynebacterium antarcticum TaxID=2800405 RepID=UPI002260FD80|nr:helix-turn-helix transcriptional regulator [Corynebacterium antarcticum]MCX7540615.1 helix-turn-helix transcriptional regulator [Corynebacterium antarcticum]
MSTDPVISNAVSRFIAERKLQGVSQAQLSRRLANRGVKLHQTAIAKIENGDRRLDLSTAQAIAKELEIPWEDLFVEDSGPAKTEKDIRLYTKHLGKKREELKTDILSDFHEAKQLTEDLRKCEDRYGIYIDFESIEESIQEINVLIERLQDEYENIAQDLFHARFELEGKIKNDPKKDSWGDED